MEEGPNGNAHDGVEDNKKSTEDENDEINTTGIDNDVQLSLKMSIFQLPPTPLVIIFPHFLRPHSHPHRHLRTRPLRAEEKENKDAHAGAEDEKKGNATVGYGVRQAMNLVNYKK